MIVGTAAEEDVRLVRATEEALESAIGVARPGNRLGDDPDGWTIRSADGSRTAHSEHTIAVTDDVPLVLTRGEPETG